MPHSCEQPQKRIVADGPGSAGKHEADHRIANSLQLVSSLLSSQRRAISDPAARQALESSVQRIAAIAGVHRQLYRSRQESRVELHGYLHDLVAGLRTSFDSSGHSRLIQLDCGRARVLSDVASTLGMIVTELVMNACKYAYRPDQPGVIDVVLTIDAQGCFTLAVSDEGVGRADLPGQATGLGTQIVNLMVERLNASGAYQPRDVGTSYLMHGRIPGR